MTRRCVICSAELSSGRRRYCPGAGNEECSKEGARRHRRRVQQTPQAELEREQVLTAIRKPGISIEVDAIGPYLPWEGWSEELMAKLRRRVRELTVLGKIGVV